jgi:hypothetical protein
VRLNPIGIKCMLRSTYKVLVGKHDGKKPLGRPRCKGHDVKLDLKEIR